MVFLWDVVSDKARALVLLSQRVSASVFVLVLERDSSSVGPSICAWVSARVSASAGLLGVQLDSEPVWPWVSVSELVWVRVSQVVSTYVLLGRLS